MCSDSLKHDVAWKTAAAVVGVFSPLLREEEKQAAFEEVYRRVREGFEVFQAKLDHLAQRVVPGSN